MGASRSRSGSLSACIPSLGIMVFFNGHFKYQNWMHLPYVYICLYMSIYYMYIYNIYIYIIYTYIYIYGLCSRAMSGKLAKHNKHKALDGKVPPYLRVLKFPLKCSRIKNSYKNKQSLSPTKVLSQNPWFGIGGWDYRNMM